MWIMLYSRIIAVRNKTIKPGYFKLYNNKSDLEVPKQIIQTGKNFTNLMEMPPLFYITCLVYMHLNQVSQFVIILAWLYVSLRIVHTFIHLTSNHVLARMLSFAGSCMVIAILWINIIGKNFL
jgi:hypothetical protein